MTENSPPPHLTLPTISIYTYRVSQEETLPVYLISFDVVLNKRGHMYYEF